MILSYREYLVLKQALGLRWQAATFLAIMIEHGGEVSRTDLLARLAESGSTFAAPKSFDVVLCQLNAVLPSFARIEPQYPGGRSHNSKGKNKAIGYAFRAASACEALLHIARGQAMQERAA